MPKIDKNDQIWPPKMEIIDEKLTLKIDKKWRLKFIDPIGF
jgi:hypothetical protein